MRFTTAAIFSLCLWLVNASDAAKASATSAPGTPTLSVVHSFGLGVWVENLFVRPSGNVLVTFSTPSPDVYQVDVATGNARRVTTFPNATESSGIVDSAQANTYYVIANNFSTTTFTGVPGTNVLWKIELTNFDQGGNATVTKALEIPSATTLDGLEYVDKDAGILVATDIGAKVMRRINLQTGVVDVILNDTFTAALGPSVDGVKIRNGIMYVSNLSGSFLFGVPIDNRGTPTASPFYVANNTATDDFILDSAGNAYLAQAFANNIGYLSAGSGTVTPLVNVSGPTACSFGRRAQDSSSLYVTTTGGDTQYPAHVFTMPGTLSRIDFGGSHSG